MPTLHVAGQYLRQGNPSVQQNDTTAVRSRHHVTDKGLLFSNRSPAQCELRHHGRLGGYCRPTFQCQTQQQGGPSPTTLADRGWLFAGWGAGNDCWPDRRREWRMAARRLWVCPRLLQTCRAARPTSTRGATAMPASTTALAIRRGQRTAGAVALSVAALTTRTRWDFEMGKF